MPFLVNKHITGIELVLCILSWRDFLLSFTLLPIQPRYLFPVVSTWLYVSHFADFLCLTVGILFPLGTMDLFWAAVWCKIVKIAVSFFQTTPVDDGRCVGYDAVSEPRNAEMNCFTLQTIANWQDSKPASGTSNSRTSRARSCSCQFFRIEHIPDGHELCRKL